ncbi:MAG: hypothetical protein AAB709_01540, partial [Patescibacteria group bacterium]
YTKQEWEKIQKEAAEFSGPYPGPDDIIAQNSDYIFTKISSQYFTDAVIDLARMRFSIVSTFVLN